MADDEFDMDVKINKVYELNQQLRVEVEHIYGVDNLGLSLQSKKINPFTDKPRWYEEVHELLKKKYAPLTKAPVDVAHEAVGQVISLKDLKAGTVSGYEKRLITSLGFTKEEAAQVMASHPDPIKLREDVLSNLPLKSPTATHDKLKRYYGGTGLGFDSDTRPEIIALKAKGVLDERGNVIKKDTEKPK